MNPETLKPVLEAVLLAADEPRSVNNLLALFDADEAKPERDDIRAALAALTEDYEGRVMELKEVASGYRFQIRADYAPWVNRLYTERPQRYSRAFLETLAIIAYRQPITRSEIEEIRGVSVSGNIIKSLQEREWIRVVGHRDVPGKPELLASTREFLDYFNLKKLSELPPLSEIKDYDQMNPDLFEGIDLSGKSATQTDPEAVDAAGVDIIEADVENDSGPDADGMDPADDSGDDWGDSEQVLEQDEAIDDEDDLDDDDDEDDDDDDEDDDEVEDGFEEDDPDSMAQSDDDDTDEAFDMDSDDRLQDDERDEDISEVEDADPDENSDEADSDDDGNVVPFPR